MDGGLTLLHTQLVEARNSAERTARELLEAAEHAHRDKLSPDDERLFRTALTTRDQLSERIAEVAEDIARTGVDSPVVAMICNGGTAPPPLSAAFGEPELKALHAATMSRQSLRVESRTTSTPTDLLPSALWQSVLGPQFESRLLDKLPTASTQTGSVEYVQHLSTTNTPTIVAESQPKPELTLVLDKLTATAQKIAAHIGCSWEALSDFGAFESYVRGELLREVVAVENDELINGTGPGHITGLLATPSTLPYHVAESETALDAIESAISALRCGAALATADLLVLHPGTWSAVRRSKDEILRYLAVDNPLQGTASTCWGVEVLVTTQIARGVGLMMDTTKFGRVHVRQPLSLQVGYSGTDLVDNITRFVAEERLALAVERPAAILAIDGLPTGLQGC